MGKLVGSLSVAIFALTGCVSLRSVSLTQIPAERKHAVSAEASKLIFLGLNFDNDFVDRLDNQLKSKCNNGKVTGILTKDETVDYFLGLIYKRQVTAEGYCIKGS